MNNIITGIDVGTTKICVIIAEITSDESVHIISVGHAPSFGLKRGMVVNINEATSAIEQALQQAESASGIRVDNAFVSIAGSHISSLGSHGVAPVNRSHKGITQEDTQRALDAARAIAIPHNRDIIHAIPRSWSVDDQQGIREPLGMHGFRLEVDAHVITGAASAITNLISCVEAHDIRVISTVLGPLAAGEAVLTPAERDMGVIVADIGGGTTDIALFADGALYHSVVLDVGGSHLTQDLAIGLHAPFKVAETLKLRYGHLLPSEISPDELVQVSPFGDQGPETVQRQLIAEILQPRAEEILEMILREIKRSGYDGLAPAGIVLTGGAAQLTGWADLSRNLLQLPVRVGAPRSGISGLRDDLRNPMFATSVGVVLWGALQQHGRHSPNSHAPWLERTIHWLRNLFPDPMR